MGNNDCRKAKRVLEEKIKAKGFYTIDFQCTSAALIALREIGVQPAPPNGLGYIKEIQAIPQAIADKVSIKLVAKANPWHLAEEIQSMKKINNMNCKKER